LSSEHLHTWKLGQLIARAYGDCGIAVAKVLLRCCNVLIRRAYGDGGIWRRDAHRGAANSTHHLLPRLTCIEKHKVFICRAGKSTEHLSSTTPVQGTVVEQFHLKLSLSTSLSPTHTHTYTHTHTWTEGLDHVCVLS